MSTTESRKLAAFLRTFPREKKKIKGGQGRDRTVDLLTDLKERYDSLKSGPIAAQAVTVARLEPDLVELSAKIAEVNREVEDSILLELVASLRDAENTEWNDLWKKAVTLNVTRQAIMIHRHKGTRVTWDGILRITGAGHTFEASFEGSFLTGAASEVEAKVNQVFENLRNGISYSQQADITQKGQLRATVAKSLGLKGAQHRLLRTTSREEMQQILLNMRLCGL